MGYLVSEVLGWGMDTGCATVDRHLVYVLLWLDLGGRLWTVNFIGPMPEGIIEAL